MLLLSLSQARPLDSCSVIFTDMARAKKIYINKTTLEKFTSSNEIPPNVEDEILEVFAQYSMEQDMTSDDLDNYFKDLHIPTYYIVGNKRIDSHNLTIEGTEIIDFDKLLILSHQLIQIRNNQELIRLTWETLLSELGKKDIKSSSINFQDLRTINESSKIGISERLLLDMFAVGTDGKSVSFTMIDLAYTLGKLGQLIE